MATNPNSKLTESVDKRTSSVEAANRETITRNRATILSSNMITIITAMALTGYDHYEDENGDIIRGEKLPDDLRERYLKSVWAKVMPTPKEITTVDQSSGISILKQIQEDLAEQNRKARFLESKPSLEADIIDVDVSD
jgi:hypothetical protein